MATNRIVTRIVSRNDTAERWLQFNPVLLKGEIGIEIDTNRIKIGDGVTAWASLDYASGGFNPENGALLETITQEMVNQWNAAQPNSIEKIFVNNAEVSIIDKSVNISVPTKASDIGAAPVDHNHDGVYLKSNEAIPAALLPSYVDDVIEVDTFDKLPTAGESGKIYVVTNENKSYRWSGTQYVEISKGVALGETADTAFRGDYGKIAYDHAMSEHAPVNAQENVVEVFKVAGNVLPVEEKTVNIPVAKSDSHGVVKSSSGANQVNVASDGTMRAGTISTSTLHVPIGHELVLDGGSSSGEAPVYPTRIGNIGYDSVEDAIFEANSGDVVTLSEDVNLGTNDSDHLVVSGKNITLDLGEKTLVANGSSGAINVVSGDVTLEGSGVVQSTLGSDNYSMAVWASSGKVVINGGVYKNVTDGSARGTDLIYASGNAQIEINGGVFEAAKPEWTLNCKDSDYAAGTANIIVKGGKFFMFNPANNNTEGAGTNYVADGYESVKEGNYYVVRPISA